jgi:hypothetical protein
MPVAGMRRSLSIRHIPWGEKMITLVTWITRTISFCCICCICCIAEPLAPPPLLLVLCG